MLSQKSLMAGTTATPFTIHSIWLPSRLDDSFWEIIPWTSDFLDIEGQKSASQRTRIKMCWDTEYFYIGAEMEEAQLWGTIKEKNCTMYHENDFEVFLDSGSSHEY